MSVNDELVDRLSCEANRRLSDTARANRRRTLSKLSCCCVTVTNDGVTTEDVIFDETPTIGQIADRVGPDFYVVSVGMKRRPMRDRFRMALAAE